MSARGSVRIGIVGLGYWGPNWLRNFAGIEHCDVAYGCDKDRSRLDRFSRQYPAIRFTPDIGDLLHDPDLDAVVIATPTATHFPLARAALTAGKHVLLEKPMTSTAAEAKALVALAKKKKRLLMVDHTFAYTEAVRHIRDLVRGGELGNMLYFDSTRINLGLIQKDASVFADLAVHDLTILDAVAGLENITEIFACASAFYGKQPEVGHLHLRCKNGLHAHIHVSWLSPVKVRQTLIGGSKAMLTYDDVEPSEKIRMYDKGVERDDTKPDPFFPKYRSGDIHIPALPIKEALHTEALHFLASIRGDEKPLVTGEDGLRMVTLLEMAEKSLKLNKPLTLSSRR